MKNKKGWIQFALAGVPLLIGIIVIILFLVFGIASIFYFFKLIFNNIFLVLGSFIIIFGGVLALKVEKSKLLVFAIAIIIGLVFIGLNFLGLTKQTALASTFSPVYCNQYEFSCCNEVVDYTQQFTLSLRDALICPITATKCVISNPNRELSYGTTNCQYSCTLWVFCGWGCNDAIKSSSSQITLKPGQTIWSSGSFTSTASITNTVYKNQLSFCGRAGCTTGVLISSSNCVMTESQGTIYTTSGSNVGKSYTVPSGSCVLSWHFGDRTICGNLEEQCTSDTDCSGHTYGNKECYARTLQTYGCNQLPLPSGVQYIGGVLVGKDIVPGVTTNPTYSGVTSRCEIKSAVQVSCCSDTDCGSNMFCDTSTFTCKTKVQCTQDTDCGVSIQCDYSTNKLKTPKCSSGQCTYSEQSVECCQDLNCPSGYTCNSEHKCQQKAVVKIACPFDCCISEDKYIDKPCVSGKFCINNFCQSTGCKSDNDCTEGKICREGNCVTEQGGKEECLARNKAGSYRYEWVESKEKTCGFLCTITFGLTGEKEVSTSYCKDNYTIYWILGILGLAIILIFVLVIIYILKSKKK